MFKVIIVGSSGHGQHLKLNLKNFNNKVLIFDGFLDVNKKLKTKYNDQNLSKKIRNKNFYFINGIGNVAFKWYPNIFKTYKKKKLKFIKLIHNTSIISNSISIGEGTVIMENVLVKSNTKIGKFCLINSQSTISHNNTIGNYCNISLGARIGGNCKIGNNTFIGMNATIRQGLVIGSNSVIGAGAVVTKNVKNNVIVIGNPAFELKKNT